MLTLFLSILLAQQPAAQQPDEISRQLLSVKRVFVDRLTGGETAAQMRDVLIASLNNAKLFIVTENQERADMILRGAAEDLVFTDSFSASEGVNIHGGASTGSRLPSGAKQKICGKSIDIAFDSLHQHLG
jgi:hypothetical protein